MKRAVLIVNPLASSVTREGLDRIESELRRTLELTVELTERPRHATDLARTASGVDAVLVYGGDGLLNEVVNGLDGTVPVGIVPGGGKNVVARALGIPGDPADAVKALATAAPRRITLGRVNGRRFVFAAGLGFDAELVRRVDALGRRSDGRRPGDVVFVREAVRLLAARRGRYEPVVDVEDDGRVATVFVSNADVYSYVAGRPLRVAPEARFELGLDLVAPRRVTAAAVPRLLAYALRGKGQERSDDVLYRHDVARIGVRAERPLALQADGEDLGDVTEAEFESEPDAIAVLVPG
jgi:diacylglycerol kinase family enzyme